MTELDIERERREFCASIRAEHPQWKLLDDNTLMNKYGSGFHWWILAKRAVLGSAEPVAIIPRRPLDDDQPDGMLESDRDFVANNFDACIALLEGRTAPPAPVSAEPVKKELESMTRMFNAACVDLGLINEALGLDPDDGGAEPILAAIEELKNAPPSTDAKDAERLDFMIENSGYVWEFDGKWSCCITDDHGMHDNVPGAFKLPTARDAIDMAITGKMGMDNDSKQK